MLDGAPVYRGKLGDGVDIETGKLSARLTALKSRRSSPSDGREASPAG
jgi:hypothetical protein